DRRARRQAARLRRRRERGRKQGQEGARPGRLQEVRGGFPEGRRRLRRAREGRRLGKGRRRGKQDRRRLQELPRRVSQEAVGATLASPANKKPKPGMLIPGEPA